MIDIKHEQFYLNQHMREHLEKFDTKDKFRWGTYYYVVLFGLSACIFLITIAISEVLSDPIIVTNPIFWLLIVSSTYGLYAGVTEFWHFWLGRKLAMCNDADEILSFLDKYGKISEGVIVKLEGNLNLHVTYRFVYQNTFGSGIIVVPNIEKLKKNQTVKVLHWRNIVHVPLIA